MADEFCSPLPTLIFHESLQSEAHTHTHTQVKNRNLQCKTKLRNTKRPTALVDCCGISFPGMKSQDNAEVPAYRSMTSLNNFLMSL